MKIGEALSYATQLTAHLDAEILLANVLQKPRSFLIAHADDFISPAQYQQFSALLTRRNQGEPLSYITKRREFWSLALEVSHDTLIPRPETELIVEWVLTHFHAATQLKIADLGTGCGAIALAIAKEKPHWEIVATDISQKAVQIASKNAQRFGFTNISFYQGNWCTALPFSDFDVIVSNPPYIALAEWEQYKSGLAYEPEGALLAGFDGLAAIREIVQYVRNYLNPKGYVVVEHGFLQGKAVRELFLTAGLTKIETVQDISGHERITLGQNDL